MLWVLLVLAYGLLKGGREIAKKKALQTNTVIEVLVFYTFLSFLMVVPDVGNAVHVEPRLLLPIALKSFVIFIAWICSFVAIKKLPISVVGILDMSRVLFATLIGYAFLHEEPSSAKIIGLVFVCAGLLMLKWAGKLGKGQALAKAGQDEKIEVKYVLMVLVSCTFNAISGAMDKVLMKKTTSSELQFWYMLFLVAFYLVYVIISKTKLNLKTLVKNYWIWLLSIMFVVADRCLFIANGIPESKVTVMTLIKQSGCLITILGGKFVFHEKNIGYKLFCAGLVIVGIVIAVL